MDLQPLERLQDAESLALPALPPRFFVSPLEDRPQNPIVENLGSNFRRVPTRKFNFEIPTPLVNGFTDPVPAIPNDLDDLWLTVAQEPIAQRVSIQLFVAFPI